MPPKNLSAQGLLVCRYKQIKEFIWDYLDSINFDCDGMEIELDENIIERNIDVKIKDQNGNIYSYQLDPFATYFDPLFSARWIAEQFIEEYNQTQAINNTIKAEIQRLEKENARIRDMINATYYAHVVKNYINNKEDNKMAKFTIGDCEGFYPNAPTPKTAERVEYEHKLLTLQRTMEDEITAAKDKYAVAVDALNKERENAKRIAEEDKAATNRKDRYDALVRAGFTEDQAWKMLMQDLGA